MISLPGKSPEAAIAAWLQGQTDEIAGLLYELIAIPTENPPGHSYRECADVLARSFQGAGLPFERIEIPNEEAPTLIAAHGSGGRCLYFHGHYDVVPTQSRTQFAPRRERDFLFGRGSCDMKGGLVSMLYAVHALKECQIPLRGRVVLTFVPDEETGGQRGSAWLAKQNLLGRDAIGMLTAEPTSGVVWNANRGAITLRIDVLGKSAHVGLQHRGENAFERMHAVVARLLKLKREVESRITEHHVGETDEASAHSTGRGPRNSILLIGGASGGGANFNVVPDNCWFTLDRRINPEEDLATEKQRLINVLEECRRDGIPLEWKLLQEGQSAESAEADSLAQALARSIEIVAGQTPRFEMCPGLLETRFYAARGIPAYAYGPGLLSVAHGANEYVDLRRVAEVAQIYALTAARALSL